MTTACCAEPLFLSEDECYAVLAGHRVGRVNFSRHVMPSSVPVPYELHGTDLLLHPKARSRLPLLLDGAAVSFEVQVADPVAEAGLRVVVVGTAAASADGWVRIQPTDVTGHRLPLARLPR